MTFLGLIRRKECSVLTSRGWIILFICVIAILVLTITNVHSFLTVNDPLDADILVVEGWLADYALEKAVNEFRAHDYRLLVTTGQPLSKGSHLSVYKNYAELAAATLNQLGIDEKMIVAVPSASVGKDRTYASALALKRWLLNSGSSVKSLNIYTLDPHARRSKVMFEKALGNEITVGVIAVDNLSYDSHNWWKSSMGVRTVIYETIAYFYARFFFWPENDIVERGLLKNCVL